MKQRQISFVFFMAQILYGLMYHNTVSILPVMSKVLKYQFK
jgi:hypothetical protein